MIRIIVRTDDASMAVNVGGSVLTTFKTFDVYLPEVEAAIKPRGRSDPSHSQVVGAEIVESAP